ncbi:hypothetical protein [Nocardioides sp. Kera G14]|uniref:hypothetical protein n=1 Tax=Nocardioides sp. Kera G14 TaxID=2884264 RepID=UPI001D11465E|nr:hypothetical protein [Nocardioides sp. Kera G14]UDY23204.1 hypothetical protein LH076_14215 [Nocardioides sp. Kera G14]
MTLTPTRSPRLQRACVFAAVAALAIACLLTTGLDGRPGRADAALPDAPFSCGSSDQNRQSVSQWNGSISSSPTWVGTAMKPCLSGTALTLTIPAKDNSATISSVQRLTGAQNIKIADGTTIPNVYQLGFKGFTINSTASNVTLKTTAGTVGSYELKLAPDAGAVFGGGDVVTDLLVDGDSTIVINDMPVSFLGTCGMLGGSGSSTCTVQVKNISQDLVSLANAIGISSFSIRQMDLKIYYIVTHNTSGGDPSGAAFQFPNTLITAKDSS